MSTQSGLGGEEVVIGGVAVSVGAVVVAVGEVVNTEGWPVVTTGTIIGLEVVSSPPPEKGLHPPHVARH